MFFLINFNFCIFKGGTNTAEALNTANNIISTNECNENINIIKNWSKNDIEDWLIINDLKEFVPVFSDHNGIHFYALWCLKNECIEKYYHSVNDEIFEKKCKVPNKKKVLFYFHFNNLFRKVDNK